MRITRKVRADIAASLALVERMTAGDPLDWICHTIEPAPAEARRVVVLPEFIHGHVR